MVNSSVFDEDICNFKYNLLILLSGPTRALFFNSLTPGLEKRRITVGVKTYFGAFRVVSGQPSLEF